MVHVCSLRPEIAAALDRLRAELGPAFDVSCVCFVVFFLFVSCCIETPLPLPANSISVSRPQAVMQPVDPAVQGQLAAVLALRPGDRMLDVVARDGF